MANDKHFRIKNGLKVGNKEVITASGIITSSTVNIGSQTLTDFVTNTNLSISSLSSALGTYEDATDTLTLIEQAQVSASAALSSALSSKLSASSLRASASDAKAASLLAQQQAEGFRDTAQAAKSSASVAAVSAEQFRDNASTFRAAAEASKSGAAAAKSDAEAAKTLAQGYAGNAENSKDTALGFANCALKSASAALSSYLVADASASAANSSKAAALTYAGDAANAETAANAARASAIIAEGISVSAKTVAQAAASDAQVAEESAKSAASVAAVSSAAADLDRIAAASAATTANAAKVTAVAAELISVSASTVSQAAASDAQAAEEASKSSASVAAVSAASADLHRIAAASAATSANTAKVSALLAQGFSVNAQTASETAANNAKTAQASSESAASVAAVSSAAADGFATLAGSAATTANQARASAVAAEGISVSAKTVAQAAASDANASQLASESAASVAAVSAASADAFRIAAGSAATSASAAQASAILAEGISVNAQTASQTAANNAKAAQAASESAASVAAVSAASADAFRIAAGSAATSANTARASAILAEGIAVSAQTVAQGAASDAQAAEEASKSSASVAAVSEASADLSRQAAASAATTANAAKVSAILAEGISINAKTASQVAANNAKAAQESSESAASAAQVSSANANLFRIAAASAATSASAAKVSAVTSEGISVNASTVAQQSAQTSIDVSLNPFFEFGTRGYFKIGGTDTTFESVSSVSSALTAGKAIKIPNGGTSGNFQLATNRKVPVDTTRSYRIRGRLKAVSDSSDDFSRIYVGIVCYDSNGSLLTPNYGGTYHYVATDGQHTLYADGNFHTFSKVVTGESTNSFDNFHTGTKFIQLLTIVNHDAASDADYVLVDELSIEDVTASEQAASSAAAASVSETNAASSATSANSAAGSAFTFKELSSSASTVAQGAASDANASQLAASASEAAAAISAGDSVNSATAANNARASAVSAKDISVSARTVSQNAASDAKVAKESASASKSAAASSEKSALASASASNSSQASAGIFASDAGEAATTASNANASAVSAKDIAVSAKTVAQAAASNALASEAAAGISELAAASSATSANSAQGSAIDAKVLAVQARTAAEAAETSTIKLAGNSQFEFGLDNYRNGNVSNGELTTAALTNVTVVTGGPTANAALKFTEKGRWLTTERAIPIDTSRKYEITARIKVDGDAGEQAQVYIGFQCADINGSNITTGPGTHRWGVAHSQFISSSSDYVVISGIMTGESSSTDNTPANRSKFKAGTKFARPVILPYHNSSTNNFTLVDELSVMDVTERELAKESASAANSSRAAAEISETNAASSATTANSAAGSAISAKDIAVSARTVAQGAASDALASEVAAGISELAAASSATSANAAQGVAIDNKVLAVAARTGAEKSASVAALANNENLNRYFYPYDSDTGTGWNSVTSGTHEGSPFLSLRDSSMRPHFNNLRTGQVFSVSGFYNSESATTLSHIRLRGGASAGAAGHVSQTYGADVKFTAGADWTSFSGNITANEDLAYWRLGIDTDAGGDILKLKNLVWKDVTESFYANSSRAAAAISEINAANSSTTASSAEASAIAAKNLAVSARTVAQGAASDALASQVAAGIFESQAASSATSANAAQGSAIDARVLAVSAQTNAEAQATEAQNLNITGGFIGKNVFEDGDRGRWNAYSVVTIANESGVPAHPLGRTKAIKQTNRDLYYYALNGMSSPANFYPGNIHNRIFRFTGYCYNTSTTASSATIHARAGLRSINANSHSTWPTRIAASAGTISGTSWQYYDHTIRINDEDGVGFMPFLQISSFETGDNPDVLEAYWTDMTMEDVTASESAKLAASAANSSRAAADISAVEAASAATTANTARASAVTAKNLAVSARTVAQAAETATIELGLNPFYEFGMTGWRRTENEGNNLDASIVVIDDSDATSGKALKSNVTTSAGWITTERKIPIDTSRIYEVRFRVRVVGSGSDSTNMYAGVSSYDASGNNIVTGSPGTHRYGVLNDTSITQSSEYVTYTGLFTGAGNNDRNKFKIGTKFASPMMIPYRSGATADYTLVDELSIADVTERELAKGSASDAEASRAAASIFEQNAASSATTAEGAAASASSSKALAASASTAAADSASDANASRASAVVAQQQAASAATSAIAAASTVSNTLVLANSAKTAAEQSAGAALVHAQSASSSVSTLSGQLTSDVRDVKRLAATVTSGMNGHYVGNAWYLDNIGTNSAPARVVALENGSEIVLEEVISDPSDLVTNGHFTTNTTGWTYSAVIGSNSAPTVSNGIMQHNGGTVYQIISGATIGAKYRYEFDIHDVTGVDPTALITSDSAGSNAYAIITNATGVTLSRTSSPQYIDMGDLTETTRIFVEFVATTTTIGLWFTGGISAEDTIAVSNISLREVGERKVIARNPIANRYYSIPGTTGLSGAGNWKITSGSPIVAKHYQGYMACPQNFSSTRLALYSDRYFPQVAKIFSPYAETEVEVYAHRTSSGGSTLKVQEGVTPYNHSFTIKKGGFYSWSSGLIAQHLTPPTSDNDAISVIFKASSRILGVVHKTGTPSSGDYKLLTPMTNQEIVGSSVTLDKSYPRLTTGGGINLTNLKLLLLAASANQLNSSNGQVLLQKIEQSNGSYKYGNLDSSSPDTITSTDSNLVAQYESRSLTDAGIYQRVEDLISHLDNNYSSIETTFTYNGDSYTLYNAVPETDYGFVKTGNRHVEPNSSRTYLAFTNIGDGSGGDSEIALPREALSDYYVFPDSRISQFTVVSVEPNQVQVFDRTGRNIFSESATYDEVIDHTLASITNPLQSDFGVRSGTFQDLGAGAGPFYFVGTAPFYLVVQDMDTQDETTMLGAKQGILSGEVGQNALASTVEQVSSQVDDAVADLTVTKASVDGHSTNFTVKSNTKGYITGFGLLSSAASAATSAFYIAADTFAIIDPGHFANLGHDDLTPDAENVPFVIQRGVPVMKTAFIQSLTASSIRVKALSGDTIAASTKLEVYSPTSKSSTYAALDGSDPIYRLYIGSSQPKDAPFSVTTGGDVYANSLTFRGPVGSFFDSGRGFGLGALAEIQEYLESGRINTKSAPIKPDFDRSDSSKHTTVVLKDTSNLYQQFRVDTSSISAYSSYERFVTPQAPLKLILGNSASISPSSILKPTLNSSGDIVYTETIGRPIAKGEYLLIEINKNGSVPIEDGAVLTSNDLLRAEDDYNINNGFEIGPGTKYADGVLTYVKSNAVGTFSIIVSHGGGTSHTVSGGSSITSDVRSSIQLDTQREIPTEIRVTPIRTVTGNAYEFHILEHDGSDTNNLYTTNGTLQFQGVIGDAAFSDLQRQYRIRVGDVITDWNTISCTAGIDFRRGGSIGAVDSEGFLSAWTTTAQATKGTDTNALAPGTYQFGADIEFRGYNGAYSGGISTSSLTMFVESEILMPHDEYFFPDTTRIELRADQDPVYTNHNATRDYTQVKSSIASAPAIPGASGYGIFIDKDAYWSVINDFSDYEDDRGQQAMFLGDANGSAGSWGANLFVIARKDSNKTNFDRKLRLNGEGELYIGESSLVAAKVATVSGGVEVWKGDIDEADSASSRNSKIVYDAVDKVTEVHLASSSENAFPLTFYNGGTIIAGLAANGLFSCAAGGGFGGAVTGTYFSGPSAKSTFHSLQSNNTSLFKGSSTFCSMVTVAKAGVQFDDGSRLTTAEPPYWNVLVCDVSNEHDPNEMRADAIVNDGEHFFSEYKEMSFGSFLATPGREFPRDNSYMLTMWVENTTGTSITIPFWLYQVDDNAYLYVDRDTATNANGSTATRSYTDVFDASNGSNDIPLDWSFTIPDGYHRIDIVVNDAGGSNSKFEVHGNIIRPGIRFVGASERGPYSQGNYG